jgi:hypothetical protein
LLVVAVAAMVLAGGCGCDVDCAAPTIEPTALRGTLTERDGAVATIELAGGTTRVVQVTGRAWALETGSVYRFPVSEGDDGTLRATMPGSCVCGSVIADADGDPVDVSVWAWLAHGIERIAIVSAIGFGAVVLLWWLGRMVLHGWEDRPALQ